jgi:hypothetical protein
MICCFQSLLSKTADRSLVRGQDETGLILAISENPIGRNLAYDYMEEK